jgi:hypothetical protein
MPKPKTRKTLADIHIDSITRPRLDDYELYAHLEQRATDRYFDREFSAQEMIYDLG